MDKCLVGPHERADSSSIFFKYLIGLWERVNAHYDVHNLREICNYI